MAHKTTYKLHFKRRRSGKTNYSKRLSLLKSGQIRIVVRKTNAYIRLQAVSYAPSGDTTLVSVSSKHLDSFGWKGSTKSIPAAYLTGLLFGKKALAKGVQNAVLDIGLHVAMPKGKLFAAVKGMRDAGLNVPASETVFPDNNRLSGKHIADYAQSLTDATRKHQFVGIQKTGLNPTQIPQAFEKVRQAIQSQTQPAKNEGA